MALAGAVMPLLPLQDDGGAGVAVRGRAAGAMGEREVAIPHLDGGMRLAAELAHRLDDLGEAAAVRRVVVAETAPVGIERQLPHPRDEVAVGDEAPAFALPAEAKILELHQHGDGEAVV